MHYNNEVYGVRQFHWNSTESLILQGVMIREDKYGTVKKIH